MQLADIQPSRPYDPTLLGRVIPGTAAQLQAAVFPASVIQGQAYVPVPGAAAASSTPSYLDLTDVPTSFTPAAHKASHATGGTDALTPGDIGAATSAALSSHTGDTGNPHSTTAAQVGAPTTAAFTAHTGNVANPHSTTAAQVGAPTTAAFTAHTSDTGNPHATTAAQVGAPTTAAFTSHTSNVANPHSTTAAQVGLGNVTNDAQVKRTEMGVASGVATLDSSGKLTPGQSIFTGPGTVTTRVLAVYGDTTGNTLAAAQLTVTTDGALQTTGVGQSGSVAGNAKGAGAIDLQTSRTAASMVANGANATIGGGNNNTASATNTTVGGGGGNTASNQYATVPGGASNTASGAFSFASGFRSIASQYGQRAHSAGNFAASGDAQWIGALARIATTDATPTLLALDGTTARFALSASQAVRFRALLLAETASAAVVASWNIEGLIARGATAASTRLVGTPTITQAFADAGAAAWAVAVTADTTNGAPAFTVTGAAATSIRWLLSFDGPALIF